MKFSLLPLLPLALSARAQEIYNETEFEDLDFDLDLAPRALSAVGLELGLNQNLLAGYSLTWHDEFTHPTSSPATQWVLPSSTNWLFDTGHSYPGGPANWGSNELQSYTKSTNNIHITSTDTLVITPRKDSAGAWTSARIETQRANFAAKRGGKLFVEAKIRTGCAYAEHSQGIWNAFWALGASFRGNYQNWPAASEWDLLEVINGEQKSYATAHCGYAPGGPCNEFQGLTNGGSAWTKCSWHYIGFEIDRTLVTDAGVELWRSESLKWFIDGKKTHEVFGRDVGVYDDWSALAYKPHLLVLNVAVGGDFPGKPNANTYDGPNVHMEVDYVRVWNQ